MSRSKSKGHKSEICPWLNIDNLQAFEPPVTGQAIEATVERLRTSIVEKPDGTFHLAMTGEELDGLLHGLEMAISYNALYRLTQEQARRMRDARAILSTKALLKGKMNSVHQGDQITAALKSLGLGTPPEESESKIREAFEIYSALTGSPKERRLSPHFQARFYISGEKRHSLTKTRENVMEYLAQHFGFPSGEALRQAFNRKGHKAKLYGKS